MTKPTQPRRQIGVAVKPQAVRDARLNAGLTLAQLAEGHVTKAAIHLIEHGRIRPSMRTLTVIARKTGKPVSYFLEESTDAGDRVDFTPLQVLAYQERYQELVDEAERLFPSVTSASGVAWLRYFLGLGYVRLGKPTRGLEEVRAAMDEFEHRGDGWMVVDCMDWEAAALQMLADPRAQDAAERALERCRKLDPVPQATEVRLLTRLGAISAGRHDWARALQWYEQASHAAGGLGDLNRLAKMYSDMSVAYQELGDHRRADAYAQKVVTIHELMRDQLSVALADHNLGHVLMKTGRLEPAAACFQRSLDLCDRLDLERARSDPLLSMAELSLTRGDPDAAERYALEAGELARKLGDRLTEGAACQLQGMVAHRRGDLDRAKLELETALGLIGGPGGSRREVECRQAYAAVLEARGESRAAIEQLQQALALATHPAP